MHVSFANIYTHEIERVFAYRFDVLRHASFRRPKCSISEAALQVVRKDDGVDPLLLTQILHRLNTPASTSSSLFLCLSHLLRYVQRARLDRVHRDSHIDRVLRCENAVLKAHSSDGVFRRVADDAPCV